MDGKDDVYSTGNIYFSLQCFFKAVSVNISTELSGFEMKDAAV